MQKKCAPLCGEMHQKNENGFWVSPALVSLVWQAKLEIGMLPKYQFVTIENAGFGELGLAS